MERKFLARFQMRMGRTGPGRLVCCSRWLMAIKLIFKEELIPAQADKVTLHPGPDYHRGSGAGDPGGGAVRPDGAYRSAAGGPIDGRPMSTSGILYIIRNRLDLGIWYRAGRLVVEQQVRHAGRYPLDGADDQLRTGAWAGLIGPILLAGSMSMNKIRRSAGGTCGLWFYQPIGVLIFLIAALAEVNRAPFDMPEAEQELTAGYHTEYSGMKFAMFYHGRVHQNDRRERHCRHAVLRRLPLAPSSTSCPGWGRSTCCSR